jgi:hypothetical protein
VNPLPIPAPVQIVVTTRPVAVVRERKVLRLKKDGGPTTVAAPGQIRQRFSARFVGGPHDGETVRGATSSDQAVGQLIRQAANSYATADEIIDFVSSLFGHDPARTADEHLARAVRMAAKNPLRVHPGVKVVLPDTSRGKPAAAEPARAPAAAPAAKGGVA